MFFAFQQPKEADSLNVTMIATLKLPTQVSKDITTENSKLSCATTQKWSRGHDRNE